MRQNFKQNKRRIEEAKKKKQEKKRLRRLNETGASAPAATEFSTPNDGQGSPVEAPLN